MKNALAEAFGDRRGPLVLLFLFINGVVLFNAVVHQPTVGYDAADHLKYIETLGRGRLPRPEDSAEFFSPPLPYLPPALLLATGCCSLTAAAKAAQLCNVVYSVLLTFFLLRTCDLLRPGDGRLKRAALLLLGLLPVYYKSFAFVRGEPLLCLLAVLAVYQALRVFIYDVPGLGPKVVLGILVGLLPLGRQWGVFVALAVGLFGLPRVLCDRGRRRQRLAALAALTLIAPPVSGWYYLHLLHRHGTVTAFNRTPAARWSLANQPRSFYLGLPLNRLFRDPVRRAFPNQLVPILYAETWGDYWCFFAVYVRAKDDARLMPGYVLDTIPDRERLAATYQTNRYEINRLLGRVNLVGLVPTAVFLGGLAVAAGALWRTRDGRALLMLAAVLSLLGYLWFLIGYPNLGKGDTIKATYLLHVFPFLAVLGGDFLRCAGDRWPRATRAVEVLLILVALHNLPALVTHCG
jgi:hypothetical protein